PAPAHRANAPLSLHDALPISGHHGAPGRTRPAPRPADAGAGVARGLRAPGGAASARIGGGSRRDPPRGRQSVTPRPATVRIAAGDRKSTRLNSSHRTISYAVF